MSAAPVVETAPVEALAERLAAAGPLAGLPAAVLRAVCAGAEERAYEAGETVFAPGQFDAAEIYFVLSGRLRASRIEAASHTVLVEEIGENAFFGLAEAIAGAAANGLTLAAETDVRLAVFDGSGFAELARKRPSLGVRLMRHFAEELARTRLSGGEAESTAERRIYAALLDLVERDAVSGLWRIASMPRHRALAERAGANETEAANAVARLISEGLARRDYPGLVVDDLAGLKRLAS